jgi:hypothetical protein
MKKFSSFLFAAALIVFAASVHAQATIYNQPAAPLAQIAGGPGAPILHSTFAATITLNPSLGAVHQILGVNTTSATCTVNAGQTGQFGQFLITILSADASGTVTYTLGTYFLPTATAVVTAGKSISMTWVSDGSNWHEIGRSASAQ